MPQILFRLAGAPPQTQLERDYSARPVPLAGSGPAYFQMGWEGGKGKGGEMIEEGKGRKGTGRSVAFHHLLFSNLTTGRK